MRAGWCAFALGAWLLQQTAVLPRPAACAVYLAASVTLLLAVRRLRGRQAGPGPDWLPGSRVRVRRAPWLLPCAVLGVALSAGFGWATLRAELRLARALPLALEGRELQVRGTVAGLPVPFAQGLRFAFEVQCARDGPGAAPLARFPRTLMLSWYRPDPQFLQALQPGRTWRLTVRLHRVHGLANPGGADTERSMLERDVRAVGTVRDKPRPVPGPGLPRWDATGAGLRAAIDRWRARVRERIVTALPGAPHAGVLVALATGLQDGITPADRLRFTRTGTNHLLAISGLHISLVAALLGALASIVWRGAARLGWPLPLFVPAQHAAALAAVAGAGAYVALSGFGVPAQRAWWMLLVAALARMRGGQTGVSTSLSWALGLVVVLDPWAVAAPGFALSFAAVAALVMASARERAHGEGAANAANHAAGSRELRAARATEWTEPAAASGLPVRPAAVWLQRAWRTGRQRLGTVLRLHATVTLALVPLSLLWFFQIPLLAIPANLLAIPWASFFVTPAVLLGVVLPAPLDGWALHAAHAGLNALSAGFDMLTAAVPGAGVWRLPAPAPLALTLALLGVLWWLAPRGWPLRHWAACLWLPMLWPGSSAPPAGEFRLTVLDVGQGGATLVETARHRLLFDTGTGPATGDAGARVVVPYLQARGIAALDLLVISHGDSDHAGGAQAVLDALPVHSLRAALPGAHRLWRQARAAGVADAAACHARQHWRWDGVDFAFLWPQGAPDPAAPNRTACVLKVSNGAHAVLLSADIEAPTEAGLLAATLPAATDAPVRDAAPALHAEVLLAPHHGSKTSSTPDFVDAIAPRYVVFQVGYRNRFHHPDPDVAHRYAARDVRAYRSDRDGAVQFETAGARLEVTPYRLSRRRYWMGR